MLGKWKHPNLMIGGMIIGDLDNQEMLEDIIIITH
jgi:hypothetical protein